jgi:hypothetical protein
MAIMHADGGMTETELEVALHPDGAADINGIYFPAPTDIAALIRITFGQVMYQMAAQSAGLDLPKPTPISWKVKGMDPSSGVVTFVTVKGN